MVVQPFIYCGGNPFAAVETAGGKAGFRVVGFLGQFGKTHWRPCFYDAYDCPPFYGCPNLSTCAPVGVVWASHYARGRGERVTVVRNVGRADHSLATNAGASSAHRSTSSKYSRMLLEFGDQSSPRAIAS
jgi:hypothetical protein